jgi:hypothetical protein
MGAGFCADWISDWSPDGLLLENVAQRLRHSFRIAKIAHEIFLCCGEFGVRRLRC